MSTNPSVYEPHVETGVERTTTAHRMLDDIGRLAGEITARAAEIEAARRVPPDLVEKLKSIGIFRMFVPQSHGGLELDIPTGLEIVRALSRIDGSVGWTAMIGSGTDLVTPLLSREMYEEIYRNGPDTIIAGSAQPVGTAEAVPGGYRVEGRWAFASGCRHADWLLGLCVMTEGGKPLAGPAGEGEGPVIRGFLLPAHQWRIEDTWHVAGLRGTGSNHISLPETLVPASALFDMSDGTPCLPGPLYEAVPVLLPMFHGAFTVGVAEGALDALLALARTGRQQIGAAVPMRQSEMFQSELGRITAVLEAAQAFYQARIASLWCHALDGTLKDDALSARAKQAAVWLTEACLDVVSSCFSLGGGAALYESSPLQRQLRDLHTAAQHAMVHKRQYVNAGRLLLEAEDGSGNVSA